MVEAASVLHIRSRKAVISDWHAAGGLVAAVLPIAYPRELLRTFGVLPVEVWGPPGIDTSPADRRLQSYTCGIVRGALSFLEAGGLDDVDLVLVPHACDSLQGLGSMLLDFPVTEKTVAPLYLPRVVGDAGVEFLTGEIKALERTLADVTGRSPNSDDLMEATLREEEADRLLGRLFRHMGSMELSERDLYRLMRGREYLSAESFMELAAPFADASSRAAARDGSPVVLSGIVPEPAEMLDVLTAAGGVIVADDTACCARRLLSPGSSEEPHRRMAQRLVGAPPCSTRGSSLARRIDHVLKVAGRAGASGVLFSCVKFCEPELFYLPSMRAALEEAGFRALVLELDPTMGLPGQVVTRLEAFLEMLS